MKHQHKAITLILIGYLYLSLLVVIGASTTLASIGDQLIIEGLEEKWLRKKAIKLNRKVEQTWRSLKLMEECLIGLNFDNDHAYQIMSSLHKIHNLRSIVKAHTRGSEEEEIRRQIISKYGNFRKHFIGICADLDTTIGIVKTAFKKESI